MKTPHRSVLKTTFSILAVLFGFQTLCMSAPSQQKASQVMELMQEGSAYYLRRDFKKAIGPYQKALDLEKQKRTLEQNLWRVLVDNLGMSYGISGNLKARRKLLSTASPKIRITRCSITTWPAPMARWTTWRRQSNI